MRQLWILGGLLLTLLGAWLWWGGGGHSPPRAGGAGAEGSDAMATLDSHPLSGAQADATGAEQPIPNLPVEGAEDRTVSAPPAPEGDPFGSKMFAVIVLDRKGQPIAGATVESVRGSATTDGAGRAWIPPLGHDLGSPTRDRRYKTLSVRASGYEALRHWVNPFVERSGATVRLRPAVPGDAGNK